MPSVALPRPRSAPWPLPRDLRAIALVHAALLVFGAVAILLPAPAQGWAVLACVVGYNVALPLVARSVGRADWVAMWAFLLPVSIFQVLPDWILADLVGTLAFPDVGGPRVDDVIPVAMGGMWVAPLFAALALGGGRPGRTAALAAGIFLGTELLAPVVDLWEPTGDTTRVLGVAIYVIPAEAALGWAAAVGLGLVRDRPAAVRVGAALAVSTFYLGALVIAHFLIDIAGWRITA
ncbi:hypothetical protein [Patulibacter sp.]|uniref:DUF6989 domain-containing protein n=1 Tax=Patulibacter sp. TaxID=1912859 RepID=UPI002728D02E|nr:hypothetical protein [Patulibacter sp.]MDO9408401.1 hypothetical protein [Patulibacter sp.]